MKEIFQKGWILKRNSILINQLSLINIQKDIVVCYNLVYQAFSVAHPLDYLET